MSAFQRKLAPAGQAKPAAMPAPKTVQLRPEQFASTWTNRPAEPVTIGLRITSERDREGASIEAQRSMSDRKLDDAEQARVLVDTYARIIVARGICDPNNVLAPHPLVPLPDDQIARAFPPNTIRSLFDELDVLNVSQSPGYSEASDEEIDRLCTLLTLEDDPIATLPPRSAARVRRLLWAVLTELE